MREKWTPMAIMTGAALIVGLIIGQSGFIQEAGAQSASSSTETMVVMGGEAVDNRTPFVVVDDVEKTIMVYEWDSRGRNLYFRAARNFSNDRLVTDYGNASSNSPSVREVQKRLRN